LKASALWHLDAQSSEIRTESLPEAREGSCLLRGLYSLVSAGTERLIALGQVPERLHHSMAVPYQAGSLALPVKYGYSWVGEVVEKGHPWEGKRVHLLHPHQDMIRVNESDLFLIPDGIPAARAALASNLETALNAVWDGEVSLGDKVLVVGLGLVGGLLALLLREIPGIELQLVDLRPDRLAWARKLGMEAVPPEAVGKEFDRAFHTSGSKAGLQLSLDSLGFEAKLIELSWYGTRPVEVRLGEGFHQQRQQIISSQVSQLPASRRARWDYRRRKETVFRLLQSSYFDSLLAEPIPFSQAPALFERLRAGEDLPQSLILAY
jgi:threonine dehydrogenase-like Zn-dependent dehydrogenase